MVQPAAQRRMTPQEYLAFERASETKHEYAGGEIFAMSGGTREHSLIGTNTVTALSILLRDKPCEVHGADMRVKIAATGRYVYPDASVVCGQPLFEDEARDTLLNPVVLVEVLSDSTEGYDRGDKFEQYQGIPTFQEYVLLSQKKARVEHFQRRADGRWVLTLLGPGQTLALDSIGSEIRVDELYRKVFAREAVV